MTGGVWGEDLQGRSSGLGCPFSARLDRRVPEGVFLAPVQEN